MTQKKHVKFSCKLYGISYYVIYDNDMSYVKKLEQKIINNSKSNREFIDSESIPHGSVSWPSESDCVIFIKRNRDWISYNVMAHEIFHAVYQMHKIKSIKLCDESEEAFAYYIGWLFEKVLFSIRELEK